MSPDRINFVDAIPLDLLRRYLVARGWKRVSRSEVAPQDSGFPIHRGLIAQNFLVGRSSGKANIDIYALAESGLPDIELLVPRNRDSSDLDQRIEGAITTLSQLEDREPNLIISSIRSIGFDVVRSRIPDVLVIGDTIQLESARNYINGMKDLLAATATTELRPQPFFGRQSKEATDYSEKCRFAHTYRGSFGFTIESPLTPEITDDALFDIEPAPPFERRVVQRLALGIKHVVEAVDSNDVRPLVDGFRNGFGANGCEKFANLIHSTAYSGMAFGFTFSPEWKVPEALRPSVEYSVGPRHVEMARAAAQALRGESLETPVDITGTVVRLQNEADPSDLTSLMGEGEISVLYSSEYGDIHVRVSLSPAEYLKAVQAHSLGRSVRVSGMLVHRGRFWFLNNPSVLTFVYQTELNL